MSVNKTMTHNLTQKGKGAGRWKWSGEGQSVPIYGYKSATTGLKATATSPDRSS